MTWTSRSKYSLFIRHGTLLCQCSFVSFSANYPAPDSIRDGLLFLIDFFVSFFVCLSARLRENGWTDLHEIFREGVEWPWDDLIQFWVNSVKPCDDGMQIDCCIRAILCCHLATENVLFLCHQDYEQMAGPICMKFSGKVWSDHGTTWLHFLSILRKHAMRNTGGVCCAFTPQLVILFKLVLSYNFWGHYRQKYKR